jgi:hypothetical protein
MSLNAKTVADKLASSYGNLTPEMAAAAAMPKPSVPSPSAWEVRASSNYAIGLRHGDRMSLKRLSRRSPTEPSIRTNRSLADIFDAAAEEVSNFGALHMATALFSVCHTNGDYWTAIGYAGALEFEPLNAYAFADVGGGNDEEALRRQLFDALTFLSILAEEDGQ